MEGMDKQEGKQPQNASNSHNSPQSSSPHSNSSDSSFIQSLSSQSNSDQLSEESSPVEAAIKTMKFRNKRGAKMNDLINGKIDNDMFWERNCVYFGGNLREKEDDEDSQDYEQSSSGRDQFDSDFNLTDSYPGKRGRKKGSKVKKAKGRGRGRGRPKKIVSSRSNDDSDEDSEKESSQQKEEVKQRSVSRSREKRKEKGTRKFRKILGNPDDEFIIFKAERQKTLSKRGRKKKIMKEDVIREKEMERDPQPAGQQ